MRGPCIRCGGPFEEYENEHDCVAYLLQKEDVSKQIQATLAGGWSVQLELRDGGFYAQIGQIFGTGNTIAEAWDDCTKNHFEHYGQLTYEQARMRRREA